MGRTIDIGKALEVNEKEYGEFEGRSINAGRAREGFNPSLKTSPSP
jgi:hypothetical protein